MRPISNNLGGFYLHPGPLWPYRAVLTEATTVILSYSYALASTPFSASPRGQEHHTLERVGHSVTEDLS